MQGLDGTAAEAEAIGGYWQNTAELARVGPVAWQNAFQWREREESMSSFFPYWISPPTAEAFLTVSSPTLGDPKDRERGHKGVYGGYRRCGKAGICRTETQRRVNGNRARGPNLEFGRHELNHQSFKGPP